MVDDDELDLLCLESEDFEETSQSEANVSKALARMEADLTQKFNETLKAQSDAYISMLNQLDENTMERIDNIFQMEDENDH